MVLSVNNLIGFSGGSSGVFLKGYTTANTTGSSITATIPSGASDGDLVAIFICNDAGVSYSVPSGWTRAEADTAGAGAYDSFVKVFVSGDTNPAFSTSNEDTALICVLVGSVASGVVGAIVASEEDVVASSLTTGVGFVDTFSGENAVLYFAMATNVASPTTTPTDFTVVVTSASASEVSCTLATRFGDFSDPLAVGDWTYTGAGRTGSVAIAVKGA